MSLIPRFTHLHAGSPGTLYCTTGQHVASPTDVDASVLHEILTPKLLAFDEPPLMLMLRASRRRHEPITPAEVVKLIRSLPDKQSMSDPLPTSLLKSNAEVLVPFLSQLFDWLLAHGRKRIS